MKIIWSAEDILGGRIVGKPDQSERWLIGYLKAGKEYALISLTDGCVLPATTAEEMANSLNAGALMPIEFFSDPGHVKRGQRGARARTESLSPERRSEIAAAAARARWQK